MKSFLLLILVALLPLGCDAGVPAVFPECDWHTHLEKGVCVPDYPEPPCAEGTHEEKGVCVADETSPRCGHGTVLINHFCVPKPDLCGEGAEWKDGKCVGKATPPTPNIEVCDGIDNNGDGQVDESDPNIGVLCIKQDYKSGVLQWGRLLCGWNGVGQKELMCSGETVKFPKEYCDNYVDDDGDGFVDRGCPCKLFVDGVPTKGEWGNQQDSTQMLCLLSPAPQEVCGNGIDDNGDGQVDEGCVTQPQPKSKHPKKPKKEKKEKKPKKEKKSKKGCNK